MEITGHKNLNLVKRALLNHLVYCSLKSSRAGDKESFQVWDTEIRDSQEILKAIDINIERLDNSGTDSDKRSG